MPRRSSISRRFWLKGSGFILALFIVPAIVCLIAAYTQGSKLNYAQEIAIPLETSFAKAGAIKKCDRGDNGRGSDNHAPWYGAVFEIRGEVEQTKSLIKQSLADAGYNNGSFSLDDPHHEWIIKDTSRPNPHTVLRSSQVDIELRVYAQKHFDTGRDASFCTLSGDGKLPDVTTFALGVRLPSFR